MKFKFNTIFFCSLFYTIIMKLNIYNEIDKLNNIVDSREEILPFKGYIPRIFSRIKIKIKYLLYVLELTYEHPEIEIYLKQLLENYNISELENLGEHYTVLHYMVIRSPNISLNSFEIIINFGVNVNKQNESGDVALHYLFNTLLEHGRKIINLFVKYGADLNILSNDNKTVLDEIISDDELDKDLEITIILLIDFGAKNSDPYEFTNVNVLEFVESYRLNNIKPAIKK